MSFNAHIASVLNILKIMTSDIAVTGFLGINVTLSAIDVTSGIDVTWFVDIDVTLSSIDVSYSFPHRGMSGR